MKFTSNLNIGLSISSCFILHFISYSPYGDYPHFLSIISAFFVFYPLNQLIFNKKLSNLYLLPLIAMNWIYFQSPFLLKEKTYYYPRKILDEYINDIAFFMCIAIILFYLGYTLFFNKSNSISHPKFKFNNSMLYRLTLSFLIGSITWRVGVFFSPEFTANLSSAIQILFYSPTITFALYVLLLVRTKSFPKLSFFHISVIAFLLFEFLLRISTTMFVSTAMLFSGAILAYFLEKKKLPIFSLLIILFLLTPIYLTRKYYRNYNKISYKTDKSQFESGSNILTDIYSDEGQEKFDTFSNKLEKNTKKRDKKNRFENLSFISQLVYYHNRKGRPFLYGSTFYWLPITPIPRIIYPNKPISKMAKEMPVSYHLRGRGGTTAINFPMFAEAYINFDFHGMLIMAFIFGLSFKWFAMKFGFGIGDLNLIIAINCFKQFTHAEGNITLVFGALIQVLLFWFVIIKIFKLDKWKPQEQLQKTA